MPPASGEHGQVRRNNRPSFDFAHPNPSAKLTLPSNPLPVYRPSSDRRMNTLALPLDLHALENYGQKELEEARSIQAEMLPAESLRAGP